MAKNVGRLVIYCCGGMGRETVETARASGRDLAFVSDVPVDTFRDIPVIRLEDVCEDDEIIISLGQTAARRQLAGKCAGKRMGQLIAPTAVIDPTASIGEGALICDFSMVNANVVVGRHFQCNYYSHVSHDCVIGDFVTFGPRVSCNGNVHIGDGANVGAGAMLINGRPGAPLVIGEGAVIGMGAVVIRDVPPRVTAVGNPARVLPTVSALTAST